jgi:hypothetical protein
MDLRETGLGVWIGFDWLRIGNGGELLWVWWWTFGFLCPRVRVSVLHRSTYFHQFDSLYLERGGGESADRKQNWFFIRQQQQASWSCMWRNN